MSALVEVERPRSKYAKKKLDEQLGLRQPFQFVELEQRPAAPAAIPNEREVVVARVERLAQGGDKNYFLRNLAPPRQPLTLDPDKLRQPHLHRSLAVGISVRCAIMKNRQRGGWRVVEVIEIQR